MSETCSVECGGTGPPVSSEKTRVKTERLLVTGIPWKIVANKCSCVAGCSEFDSLNRKSCLLAAGNGLYTDIEQWGEIRCRVLTGQISNRAACKEYDSHWDTLEEMLTHSQLPGWHRSPSRPSELGPFPPVSQQILKADKSSHCQQRHTVKKISERHKDEHGCSCSQMLVSMALRDLKPES